jgi:ADP-ribose pyrophosphatase YjhB (NUDIX family)
LGIIPVSAGLALFRNDRRELLLAHPTNAPWWGAWSIPKGMVEAGESMIDAAIRETREEVGLTLDRARIDPTEHRIAYIDKKGRTTKIVVWFLADVADVADPLPASQLQLAEVDHASFFSAADADRRILARLRPILEHFRG